MNDNEIITEGELFDHLEMISKTLYVHRVRIPKSPYQNPNPVDGSYPILREFEVDEYELLVSDSGKRGWRKRS